MGNVVFFRRDPRRQDAAGNGRFVSRERKDRPTASERPNFIRFSAALRPASDQTDRDGYVLLLLADQELAEGRAEQAETLIEAAYDAFDRLDETRQNDGAERSAI